MREIYIIFIVVLSLSLNIAAIRAEENYCNDNESWEEWDSLFSKYPDDSDMQTLHALRLGLYFNV